MNELSSTIDNKRLKTYEMRIKKTPAIKIFAKFYQKRNPKTNKADSKPPLIVHFTCSKKRIGLDCRWSE